MRTDPTFDDPSRRYAFGWGTPTPRLTLAEAERCAGRIRTAVATRAGRQSKLWRIELKPALAEAGIVVGRVDDLRDKELDELTDRFDRLRADVRYSASLGGSRCPARRFPP